MVKYLDLLSSLDFLSSEVSLTSEFNSRIKNPFGGCLSLLLVLTGIAFTIVFGYELVAKEKPITSTVDKVFDDSTVNLHDYPIAFSLMDNTAADLGTNTAFMASIKLIANLSVIPDANSGIPMRRVTYEIKDCTSDLMKEEYLELIRPMPRGKRLFCIDYRQAYLGDSVVSETPLVRNDYTSNDSSFLNIEVHRCTNGEEYCSDYKAPADAFYMNLYTISSFLNLRDSNDPVKNMTSGKTIAMSYSLYKRSIIDLQIGTLISDEGWLFEDNMQQTWVYEGNSRETVDVQSVRNGRMSILTFTSPRLRKVYYRSYMKVQELMAQIGGFLKGFVLICKLVCKPFSNFVLFSRLRVEMADVGLNKGISINNFNLSNSQNKIVKAEKQKVPKLSFKEYLSSLLARNDKTVREVTKYLEIGFISKKMIETEREAKEALRLVGSEPNNK